MDDVRGEAVQQRAEMGGKRVIPVGLGKTAAFPAGYC